MQKKIFMINISWFKAKPFSRSAFIDFYKCWLINLWGCEQYFIIQLLIRLSAATPPQSQHTNLQRGIRYYPAAIGR